MDDYRRKSDSDRNKIPTDKERFRLIEDGDTIFIEEDNTIYELDKKCAETRGMRDRKEKT